MIASSDKAEFDRLTAAIRYSGFTSVAHAAMMVKQGRADKVVSPHFVTYAWKENGFFGLSIAEIRILHRTVMAANPVPGAWLR